MRTHRITRSPFALGLFVGAFASLAHAQSEEDAASSAPQTPAEAPFQLRLGGGYLHQFNTAFEDGPGSASVDRGYFALGSRFELTPSLDLGLRLAWEGGWYHFDGVNPLSLGTGASPWNSVQGIQVGGRLAWKMNDQWSLALGLFGGAAGEPDADAGDSLSIGGSVGVTWRANERFMIGGGILASSQIEDDVLVVPLLLLDWRITDDLRLTNVAGPEAYPTGAGLELVCTAIQPWEFGVGGRWESRRFRLDTSGPAPEGVGADKGLGTWLRAGVRPVPQLRLDLLVGVMFAEEFELSDRNGNSLATVNLDPSPFVAGFASWRF